MCVDLGLELVAQGVDEATVAQVVATCEVQCDEDRDLGDACGDLRQRLQDQDSDADLVQRVTESCLEKQRARRDECRR